MSIRQGIILAIFNLVVIINLAVIINTSRIGPLPGDMKDSGISSIGTMNGNAITGMPVQITGGKPL